MYRHRKKHSSLVSQMNVVPYIDVMLVLLVIFMVTAPMFNPGVINLPTVSKSNQIVKAPIIVKVSQNDYELTFDKTDKHFQNTDDLLYAVKKLAGDEQNVVISADKTLAYGDVLKVVDKFYASGLKRVGLIVKQK